VLEDIEDLLRPVPRATRALDFGAGDGWFATQLERQRLAERVIATDVKIWAGLVKRPVMFDGLRLPFGDRAFDLTYAIDVLHHCPQPEKALEEVLRCTRKYFLIKDHTYSNRAGWATLCVLDEIGNRRFAVPSPHHYQERWTWDRELEQRGFTLERRMHPERCHVGPLGYLTNSLQFIALWRRTGK
jgi:SAM-dependent methyltransferase